MDGLTPPVPVYLDHAATTAPCAEAIDAMRTALETVWGNPSSIHGKGQEARALVDRSRDQVADYFSCLSRNVIFTSSGTEADNLALHGILGRWGEERGRHIVVTAIEHEAILETARALGESGAATVTIVQPDREGRILPESVAAAVREDTVLVSVMLANNETGVIEDIPGIASAVKRKNGNTFVHTDAVQGAGLLACSLDGLLVDCFSVSSHKLYGPKGTGCLVLRDGVFIRPHITGGGQERNRRSGTEGVPGIAGFAAALRARSSSRDAESARLLALRTAFVDAVTTALPDTLIPGAAAERLPSCVSFIFPGIRNEQLLARLDAKGVCASGGSACSAGAAVPSHVLHAMGYDDENARGLIRCTMGTHTTRQDVDYAAHAIVEAVTETRSLSGGKGVAPV